MRPTLSELDERGALRTLRPAPAAHARRLGRDAPQRRGESVVVIPSVTLDRRRRAERHADAGVRGAIPFPAAAAPPAAAAHGVRDVDADRARHRRVLPGAAARCDPEPCPVPADARLRQRLLRPAAQPEVAGAPAATPPDRGAHPRPDTLPSRAVQHHRAGARCRTGARHPHVRRRPAPGPARHEDRVPAAVRRGGRAASDRVRGPAHLRRARRRLVRMRAAGRPCRR